MNIIQQGLASSALQSSETSRDVARDRDKRVRDARGGQTAADQLELSSSQRIADDAVEKDAAALGVKDDEHGAGTTAEVLDTPPVKGHAKPEERVEAVEKVASETKGERPVYQHVDLKA
ncbi:MAG: hypothetical protein RLN76_12815 [Phycisphaeraceae bacterium]